MMRIKRRKPVGPTAIETVGQAVVEALANRESFPRQFRVEHVVEHVHKRPTRLWIVWNNSQGQRFVGRPTQVGRGAYQARMDVPAGHFYLKEWPFDGSGERYVPVNEITVEFDYDG